MLMTSCYMQFFLEITSVTFRPVLNSQTQQHKYSFTQMQFWEEEV